MNKGPPREAELVGSGLPCKESSPWSEVRLEDSRDWHWHMRNRITTGKELEKVLHLTC